MTETQTPVEAPVEAPAASPEAAAANVFDELVKYEIPDEPDEGAAVPDSAATEEGEKSEPAKETPAPAPAAAKPVEAPKPAPVEAKPPEPAKPAAPVEAKPAEPAAPPFEPEKVRANMMKELEGVFALSKEESELLATEPEKVYPIVQARTAMWVYEALYYTLASMAPQLVRNVITQDTTGRAGEEAFFSAWPELKEATKDANRAEQLKQVGAFWRGQNPKASREQAIEGIGALAMTMLGLQRTPAPAAPAAPKPTPVAPGAPARANGGPAKPTAPSNNPFAALVDFEMPDDEE